MKTYICEKPCFRDGTLFQPGDKLETDKYKTAPKHFEGYDLKKDPDPKKKAATKKAAIKAEEKTEDTAPAATPAVDPAPAKKAAPAAKKTAPLKEGELDMESPKE